ncbi:MAG: hypothetical protein A3G87_00870 [Omnitrophica bacterium RIFCSPLOWO2_12_FULL_50_11]|nr:MAG: hypothetical protein A3G87_00870 [Omnitrophica bacterium RIFCSPLOWO2_12_FULL_50_11]
MKYAIISDVHSNLEALERVLSEIKKANIDQVICLGDVVGYGANPSECLMLVREVAAQIIMGNHDQAIEDAALRNDFTPWAKEAIEWTASVLDEEDKRVIRDFPRIVIDRKAKITWTHGSVHEPGEFHYLFSSADAQPTFRALETDFCFFGHTHIPSLFTVRSGLARYLPAGSYRLPAGERYVLNPGSIGQPRDRSPKLSFAFFDSDDQTLEIVRLDYDNETAARKIRKAGLPAFLADRLL